MGNEGVMSVPWVAQGALAIPPQYNNVPWDFADEGLVLVHIVRQWIHGREWRVRFHLFIYFPFDDCFFLFSNCSSLSYFRLMVLGCTLIMLEYRPRSEIERE